MTIHILTLFPEIFDSIFSQSIVKRAQEKKLVKIKFINIRDFASDKHKTVDNKPYGGGTGMVLKIDIIVKALQTIKSNPYKILLSANGKKYNQQKAVSLAKKNDITIICGHYEGVDARVEKFVDETISIGDFILTGGEIPAMLVVDSITRLIPGSINPKSPLNESFENRLLEYPQYTRPENFRGYSVPSVLLNGNHKEIQKWRKNQSKIITQKNRPDLITPKKV